MTNDPRPSDDPPQVTEPEPGGPAPSGPAVPSARARWQRHAAAGGLALIAVFLPLWLRVAVEGSVELARADQARARQALPREVEHLGRALRWRAPLLDHDEEALARLWAIGEEQRAAGPPGRERALLAYREIRRGLLATRAWGIPHRARWDEANAHIAALMAAQERARGIDTSDTAHPDAFHRTLLDRVPGPEPARGYLAALAFVGWIGAVVGFVLRGLDARGRLRPRPALRWGLAALLALVAWTVALAMAHPGA